MPRENRFVGLDETVESESKPDTESDDEQTANEGTIDESKKSEPEPAIESESEGNSALSSKTKFDPGSDEASKSDDTGEGSGVVERNDDDKIEEATESDAEADGVENVADTRQATETVGDPTFEFEATTVRSIYVRTATFDRLGDAESGVESLLRREYGVRDLTGREFHDVLVRAATEYPEEIVDVVLKRRDE